MKHISLFFLLCVLSFGATSELVVPKGNNTIIDIGRNYKPSNMELPKEKEIEKYAASVREVASIVNMKNRDIHMTECVVDKNSKEGCPLNTVQCVNNICPIDSKIACVLQSTEDGLINVVGNYIYEGGLSTEIKKVSVKPKECTNGTLVGDICIGKTVPACESGYELNGDKCERISRTNTGLVQDIVPSGYGGCTDGFSVGSVSGNKYFCEKSMANGNCPSGFSLINGKCERKSSGLSVEYSNIVTDYADKIPVVYYEDRLLNVEMLLNWQSGDGEGSWSGQNITKLNSSWTLVYSDGYLGNWNASTHLRMNNGKLEALISSSSSDGDTLSSSSQNVVPIGPNWVKISGKSGLSYGRSTQLRMNGDKLEALISSYDNSGDWSSSSSNIVPIENNWVLVFNDGSLSNWNNYYYLRSTYTCPTGMTLEGTRCKGIKYVCPGDYADNGSNCKKNYGYFYYDYSCPTAEFGYIKPKNEGLSTCLKSDPNISIVNQELADNCNSPVAPNDNCTSILFPECSQNQNLKTLNGIDYCSYSSSPTCAPDYELINASECLKNSWNCPVGYVSDSKGCLKKDTNCTAEEKLINGVCIKEASLTCENEYKLDKEKKQCYKEGTCPIGYKDMGATCVRNYSWFEYSCPAGYEGPFEKGFDCEGTKDVCNSPTPPQSNCKKAITLNSAHETSKTYRDLELHPIVGDVSIGDYGAYKDLICGNECNFNIKKITGENSDICFYKNNGFKECVTVRGCYFSGSIENLIYPYEITDLYAPNQNKINIVPVNQDTKAIADEDQLSCPNGLKYNPALKYCDNPPENFYTWTKVTNGGDGNWVVQSSGAQVYQTNNSSPETLFVTKNKFPQDLIVSGDIMVNDSVDDDEVGIVFNYKDASNYTKLSWWSNSLSGSNYNNQNTINALGGPFVLTEVKNGSKRVLKAGNPGIWKPYITYKIKAVVNENSIKAYINDTLYIEYENKEYDPVSTGHVGFFNYSQSNVIYRNFYIQSKPICPAGFTYDAYTRYCYQPQEPATSNGINSTCKVNGHAGWLNRAEGIVSIKSEKDRILFWDSFKDRYLGAFEFVRDVKDEDKKDGYVAEKVLPYEMLAKGFTSIGTNEGKTYYTSANNISDAECSSIASKMSLTKENVTGNNDFLKTLTGNRFKELKIEPKCESGFYSTAAKSCIDLYSTKDTSCAYGKYDKINSSSGSMQRSMVYDQSQGASNTVYSAISIQNGGVYRIKVGGLGSTSVYINNNLVASVSGGSEKLVNINLNIGLYEIKVVSSGTRGWAVEFYDEFFTLMSSSENWCKQTPNSYCPEDGFAKVGNLCLEKRLNECSAGEFDINSGLCVLPPKCILSGPIADFQSQTKAMKSETLDKSKFKSMCSSLVCDGGMCGTATCPSGFSGSQFPYGTTIPTGTCIGNVCDANKDYYEYCGQPNGCDKTNPLIYEASNGKCYELYCPAGKIMNIETKNCETF